MNKIDLGQTMNTLANVGVILGIVFLAFELRQSQLVGRAQTRNEVSRAALEMNQSSPHAFRRDLNASSAPVCAPGLGSRAFLACERHWLTVREQGLRKGQRLPLERWRVQHGTCMVD